jgi:transcription elongation factor Elf1
MKKLVVLLVAAVLLASLSACATKAQKSTTRVKCPACGYEFEVPATP